MPLPGNSLSGAMATNWTEPEKTQARKPVIKNMSGRSCGSFGICKGGKADYQDENTISNITKARKEITLLELKGQRIGQLIFRREDMEKLKADTQKGARNAKGN